MQFDITFPHVHLYLLHLIAIGFLVSIKTETKWTNQHIFQNKSFQAFQNMRVQGNVLVLDIYSSDVSGKKMFKILLDEPSKYISVVTMTRTNYYTFLHIHIFKLIILSGSQRAHFHVLGMLPFTFLTLTNQACTLLFIQFLCLFLSLWPFQLYFIP